MSAKALFKSIIDAQWAGVQAWVTTKQEESLYLEFKDKHPKDLSLNDNDWGQLATAMSAFANAEGGVYVFGVFATPEGKNYPDRVQSVNPLANIDGIKGAFERRLSQLTEPPIYGIDVIAINCTDNQKDGIIVVYIPKSEQGPHCTKAGLDKSIGRYYMRCNVTTIQMHHGLLSSMFGRPPAPLPYLVLICDIGPTHESIEFIIGNSGRGYADRPAIRFDQVTPGFAGQEFINSLTRDSFPAGDWSQTTLHAGFSSGVGCFFRSNEHVTLYPGLELLVCSVRAARPDSSREFTLSANGVIFALNMKPLPFSCKIPLSRPQVSRKTVRITLSKDDATGVLSVVTMDTGDETEQFDS